MTRLTVLILNEEFRTCWYWRFSLETHYEQGEVHNSHMDLLEEVFQLFPAFLDSNEEFEAFNSKHLAAYNSFEDVNDSYIPGNLF